MTEPRRFGRYTVKERLGRGAMGVVYLAEDPVIGREVAIKVIQTPPGASDKEQQEMRARFEREFRSAGTLSHPNIVTIHDVGQQGDSSFIAMELIRGRSLQEILHSHEILSFKDISDIVFQVCSALDYAHERGIVHRDIKPANILMTRQRQAKLTDFGVAKLATATLTRTGTIIGTPAYMSPEQVQGHTATPASDQFSVAIVVYEMLTGELPFSGDSPTTIMYKIVHEQPIKAHELNRSLPERVDKVLMRALDKGPKRRYERCTEFAEAIREVLGATPISSTTVSYAPTTKREDPSQRRVRLGAAIGAAALALVVTVWVWTGSSGPATDPASGGANVVAPGGEGGGGQGGEQAGGAPGQLPASGGETEDAAPAGAGRGETAGGAGGEEAPGTGAPATAGQQEAATGGEERQPAGEETTQPAAPRPMLFRVSSNPSGADVILNGERVGTTPRSVELMPETDYRLVVEMPGYESQSYPFSLETLREEDLEDRDLFFPLVRDAPPGVVVLDGSFPVRLELDGGRAYEVEPGVPFELGADSYEALLTAPSVYFERRQRLEVVSGEQATISLPPVYTITVIAVPAIAVCEVFIDGIRVGPAPQGVTIAAGDHRFRWQCANDGHNAERTENVYRSGARISQTRQ